MKKLIIKHSKHSLLLKIEVKYKNYVVFKWKSNKLPKGNNEKSRKI